MSTVLVTGASGFIAKSLSERLAGTHRVVQIGRTRAPDVTRDFYRGDFGSFEDLRRLDDVSIDTVVHLAAVTGGCSERDGMLVNVEGTRRLMRYLIDRGCRKFVMASSIAAVGMQSPDFRPVSVPIADEHPCLDRDGYGFSKYLMEEVTRYYNRQNPDIDVVNLRLTSVLPDDATPPGRIAPGAWALGRVSGTVLSDICELFERVVDEPVTPGVRTFNAGCDLAWTTIPTADLLADILGSDVDLSFYRVPGNEYASVYDMSAIRNAFGFDAGRTRARLDQFRGGRRDS